MFKNTNHLMLKVIMILLFISFGCSKDKVVDPIEEDIIVDDIIVTPVLTELTEIGQTIKLTATAFDVDTNIITGKSITWSSSNSDIVQVNNDGLSTAMKGGTATITASVDSISGSAIVNVKISSTLGINLKSGDYWEYLWNWESENYAQGSGTDFETEIGIFTVTLQAPKIISGIEAFSVSISGNTSNGSFDYAPEWSCLAVGSDGSLLGSKDGSTLKVLYDASSTSWSGGGYFIPFPSDQTVSAFEGQFSGAYNQTAALVVSRQTSSGGCTYYPSIGQTICSGDPMTITEREYYKEGVGPLGYFFESQVSYSGGGFYTSHRNTHTVELINTSLVPTDGSVFHRPPWEDVTPLNTARYLHASVVLNGQIYTIGGHDGNNSLSSMEVYNPGSNSWRYGKSLPAAVSYHTAEVVDGKIYVVVSYENPVYIYNPSTNSWSSGANSTYKDPSHGSCAMDNDYVVCVSPNGAYSGQLNVFIYQVSQNKWLYGYPASLTDHRWFSVASIENDLFVVGGYRQFLDTKVSKFIHHYDAAQGTWKTFAAQLIKARYSATSVTLNGEIITLGGRNVTSILRDVEALNPNSMTSRALPDMLRPREEFDAVVLDGKIYVIGGNNGSIVLNNVEVYTP